MLECYEPSPYLTRFGVSADDPGYIYVIRSESRLKIGRSTGKRDRLRQAKTWIPDGEVLGIKPFWNHRAVENYLHLGLTMFWYKGEWYDFDGDEFEEAFVADFIAFDDADINRNSIDFIYLMNSSGMSEYTLEYSQRNVSKAGFQREECINRGGDGK